MGPTQQKCSQAGIKLGYLKKKRTNYNIINNIIFYKMQSY